MPPWVDGSRLRSSHPQHAVGLSPFLAYGAALKVLSAASTCHRVRQASPWRLSVSHQLCWRDTAGFLCTAARSGLEKGLQDAQKDKITSCVTSRVNNDLNDWLPGRYTPLQFLSQWKTWQRKFDTKLRVITRLRWPADSKVQNRNVASCNVATQPDNQEKYISY